MTDPAITLQMRSTPATRVGITMRWRELLFLHYACDPEVIQARLPDGLTVDTFPDESGQERAWVGLVPFRMEGVRPKGLPRIKSLEDFPETNVRTYCHREGADPGVWFFSLDAANPLACQFARAFFHLNYVYARMTVIRSGDRLEYGSSRCRDSVESRAWCEVGEELGKAEPGTLEFFLVERYLLYSERGDWLFKGQVFHPPYRLRRVVSYEITSGLVRANSLPEMPFTHALFSEGVDVSGGKIASV